MLEAIGLLFVVTYTIGPISLWLKMSENFPAEFHKAEEVDSERFNGVRKRAMPLVRQSFVERGAYLFQSGSDLWPALVLLDQTGTTGCLVAELRGTEFNEFSTVTRDGNRLLTNDAKTVLPLLGHLPNKTVRQYPGFDLVRLHEAHRKLVKHELRGELRTFASADEVISDARANELKEGQSHVDNGWASINDGKKSPTLRGAFLMSFRVGWPMSAVRRWYNNRLHASALDAAKRTG